MSTPERPHRSNPAPACSGVANPRRTRQTAGSHHRCDGEPTLHDVLDDPIVDLMMLSDGVSRGALEALIDEARSALWRGLCQVEGCCAQ